jgi:hypothetical protein
MQHTFFLMQVVAVTLALGVLHQTRTCSSKGMPSSPELPTWLMWPLV